MKANIGLILGWTVIFGCVTRAQPAQPAIDPWISAADELPPLSYNVAADLVIDRTTIEAYTPVIARITLTNRDDRPLALKVRQNGAPYRLASLVARGDESFFRHHQWLRTSGPSSREISLAPGESTTGEILILFGSPPTGAPFAEPGQYRVKFGCQPDPRFAPVYTNEVRISVTRDDRDNALFLDELSEIVYSHYGWDRESVIRANGEEYIPGIEILKRVIKVQKPHLVDPERNPEDMKEAELVDALMALLVRHPNSSYAGYVARYLGLVHLKTLEHEWSLAQRGSWKEAARGTDEDDVTRKVFAAYDKALRYLTMANKADIWPRAPAMQHLGWLHIMTEEWDKADACLTRLRTKYAESDGVKRADELEREMAKYKAKLARRKGAAP